MSCAGFHVRFTVSGQWLGTISPDSTVLKAHTLWLRSKFVEQVVQMLQYRRSHFRTISDVVIAVSPSTVRSGNYNEDHITYDILPS